MVFSPVIYHVSRHAIDQTKRSGTQLTEQEIKQMAKQGTIIYESTYHRYIRYQNFRLPCVKKTDNEYVIKSFIPVTMRMRLVEEEKYEYR
jgi:hypothetical protein